MATSSPRAATLITNQRRTDPETRKIPPEKLVRTFDVLVNSTGVGTLGRVAQVLETEKPTTVDSHVTITRPNPDEVDPYFFGFVMRALQPAIEGLGHGSTGQTELSRARLASLRVSLPPRGDQISIAHVLGTLDDKIELNRRMNRTLEAIARAIFKSWFVDFDPVLAKAEGREPVGMDPETAALFPDEFQDSPIGKIPKGWEVSTVGDEFDVTMGQSPPGSTYNESGDGLPFFQGRRDFGFRFPKKRVFCSAPKRIAEAGDTLVSVRAPVGDVNMAPKRLCLGRGLAGVRHYSGSRSFTYYSMLALQDHFREYESEGTVFGAINKSQFAGLEWVAPSSNAVEELESRLFAVDETIRLNEVESSRLASVRDTLLPKLLSGHVRAEIASPKPEIS